ncbi:DNA mismatch endonuclease Vsr [Paraburkholderia sp. Ac-20336]|uniref:very short patch repair endonuclease n=1 Tax=Paraburkholderia sp. Ac-20336 TaxID=2703886 RepID=UPI001980D0ED|nr:very short patch repair endonuclease [Paraburkholderia sp. Ac-20336]MBN3803193.1 DNA mismatch endonuclease Vsr [Paraburkholderia sp. Ac-20336]
MVDTLTPAARSKRMSLIRGKNTGPEMTVRRLIYAAGYRYRLHGMKLPGRPDLVFSRRRKVIFVHGCFWHRHEGCRLARLPKSRLEFWGEKLEGNRQRDMRNLEALRALGWATMVVWECELADEKALIERIRAFLE